MDDINILRSVEESESLDWSLCNDPEFSVHNFRDPNERIAHGTLFNHQERRFSGPDLCEEHNSDQNVHKHFNNIHVSEQGTLYNRNVSESSSVSESTWYHVGNSEESNSLPVTLNQNTSAGLDTINAGQIYRSFPPITEPSDEEEDGEGEPADINLKTSLMSVWNNMKNGFTVQMKTNFKYDTPIWILGEFYHCTKEERELQKAKHENGLSYITRMDEFKTDFSSRIWFTYRKEFSNLPFSQLTTDMGWGCMLRSGQMMVAQALILHLLGRDWRHQIHRRESDIVLHKRILHFFSDMDSVECPFSIHNLVKIGKVFGKNPGDWYGPSSVAHVLRQAMLTTTSEPLLQDLCVYVAQDCTLYIGELLDLCYKKQTHPSHEESNHAQARQNGEQTSQSSHFTSVVVLIPVRLGGVSFNPVYAPCIKTMLAHKYCIGVIGGKPKHSLYFVGWQEEKLIYLDPHFCQDTVDTRAKKFSTLSFHCNSPRKMSINKMDPSCTIGFYCKTREDLETFIKEAKMMSAPPNDLTPHPMFVFQDGRSEDSVNKECDQTCDRILKVQHYDSEGRKRPPKDSDDFVML